MAPRGIFEDSPLLNRCSLCGSWTRPFILEARPTRSDFTMETWPYCAPCWAAVERERGADLDPVVISKWLRLIGIILFG